MLFGRAGEVKFRSRPLRGQIGQEARAYVRACVFRYRAKAGTCRVLARRFGSKHNVFERTVGRIRSYTAGILGRSEHFLLEHYIGLLRSLLDFGVQFRTLQCPIEQLEKTHFIKHDIHHDLINTYHMAAAEAELGVSSTFFMMHRNSINKKYFDEPKTWRTLRAIQKMGHHIGLHVDGFELIEEFGDLAAGTAAAKRFFATQGIDLTIGNTHGNSAYQARLNFEPMNFYREVARPTQCGDAFWMTHYSKYSLAELGFRVWADTAVWMPGVGEHLFDYFVSDNSTGICVGESSRPEWQIVGEKWDLSRAHRARVAGLVRSGSCIYLIHPQFYRPRGA